MAEKKKVPEVAEWIAPPKKKVEEKKKTGKTGK